MISTDGRLPWVPLTAAELLDHHERRLKKEAAEHEKQKAEAPALDPVEIQKGYETMKTLNARAAEEYLANAKKIMAESAVRRKEMEAQGDERMAKQFAELRALRARLTPVQLQAPARDGRGLAFLAEPGDLGTMALVKLDPTFFDTENPDRIQLISVNISVIEQDEVAGRRETMRMTKQTLDYQALARLLR